MAGHLDSGVNGYPLKEQATRRHEGEKLMKSKNFQAAKAQSTALLAWAQEKPKPTTIDQAQARNEQAAIEATPEYRIEQELNAAFKLIEDELFDLEDEDQAAAQVRNATIHCQDGSWW